MTPPSRDERDVPVEELAEAVELHNEDRTTKREAVEQELIAQDRSEEGEELGDLIE